MPDAPSRLRQIRQILGKTQKGIASDVGVSEATWQRLEGGALPTGETLLGIAKLGFSPTWVLLGTGAMRLDDVAPVAPVAPGLLYRAVDIGRLDAAFREALERCSIAPAELGDTSALMLLTVLLHDAAVKAAQGRSDVAHAEGEVERIG